MNLTAAQQRAIEAQGNVLVIAGAGTGKTRTLVERCLGCLFRERPRVSLDELLVVTFTEAAATEMRQRIRDRLEQERARQPEDSHWPEQLALFDTAPIGTLHSFCLQLVRQHFYDLGLDPQITVLPDEEAQLLAEETLERLLQKYYAGRGRTAVAVQELIRTHGRGTDRPIRRLLLRLHRYAQTLPESGGWLRKQQALFEPKAPTVWQPWLDAALADWQTRWLPELESLAATNGLASACLPLLKQLSPPLRCDMAGRALESVLAEAARCPRGQKSRWGKPLEGFFAETRFLNSLATRSPGSNPLAEDWSWVRQPMLTLLRLAQEFGETFAQAKRELGVVDFHDLEQHSLRLLWDPRTSQPTRIAQHWRSRLRFVLVDEYQDINAAQDKIIEALSREDSSPNRFLVGDAKQSIYRFRLANPSIFQNYVATWSRGAGGVIALNDNFRSREPLLKFINSFFQLVMRRRLGGVDYDATHQLQFGSRDQRAHLSEAHEPGPRVELHVRLKHPATGEDGDLEAGNALLELRDLAEAEREARLVALRLKELRATQHRIWDETAKAFRPADWGDMAVLLRAPAGKAESYAKAFAHLGVPLQAVRRGFYQSTEVTDLLSLLQVLDNPLQDIPLLAVLHSPLVGLTLKELAQIRLALPKGHFWAALVRWQLEAAPACPAHGTASRFLERFGRWRRLARQVSLSRCLEAVLAETHYAAWLLTQPRGHERHANVQHLLSLALEFDQFHRQGLFRFLRFVEAQQLAETEPEVAALQQQNAVRLLSIHQSKGLEFPVVVVADLGKPFNLADLHAEILLDQEYGLCPLVHPPGRGKRYPSLPYWLARRRQLQELLGEELRLLYVAMTRARDTLILTASVHQRRFFQRWQRDASALRETAQQPQCYADWIGSWFARHFAVQGADTGEDALLRWQIVDDARLAGDEPLTQAGQAATEADSAGTTPEEWEALRAKLEWQYDFLPSTRHPAKIVLPGSIQDPAPAESLLPLPPGKDQGEMIPSMRDQSCAPALPLTPALAPALALTPPLPGEQEQEQEQEHGRQVTQSSGRWGRGEGELTLELFWRSELGRRLLTHRARLRHNLVYTARFTPAELKDVTGQPADPSLEGEFVTVQGVADLVILQPKEIWVVKLATEEGSTAKPASRMAHYAPPLRLCAEALSRIYHRPVTGAWLYVVPLDKAFSLAELGA